jgi:apolipoprotein N-acyltransferase
MADIATDVSTEVTAGKLYGFLSTAGLLASSVGLLTLGFAPIDQFYLAWLGLVPWLIFLERARSQKAVFFWSWFAGTLFFVANMWWMAHISVWGMLALLMFCGTFWGYPALIIRGANLLHRNPVAAVLGIATAWTAFEWVRGIIFTGLPWLFIGYSQTAIPALCQIADLGGSYAVTFWVVCVNVVIALGWINRGQIRAVIPAVIFAGAMTVVVIGYGIFRIQQTARSLSPGPRVAVVQANYPQNNQGEKPVDVNTRLDFHVKQTLDALNQSQGKIDMVVWSETMMEGLNASARLEDPDLQPVYEAIRNLASSRDVAILTGGDYWGNWHDEVRKDGTYRVADDRRNSAYLFDKQGQMDDSLGHRYDKIHLVPWGEFIPGKESMPFLYKLSVALGPAYYTDYIMEPGEIYTVFHLKSDGRDWRFATPICFEDIDARICSAMFRPDEDGKKRADFLVNITNDGWFWANENADHLQAAAFRSIENRAWTARSVNTGISGFIDSVGRLRNLLPVRTEGVSVDQIMIDARLSFYTRYGDLFAFVCVGGTVLLSAWAWWKRKKSQKTEVES